tara:strand:- start:296 stop:559 length:264 start_codon:yes stop_codon:yes gene_type:complete
VNAKQIKKLRKLVRPIQVEWLRELLPEDQAKDINIGNVEGLLPEQTHAFGQGQLHMSYMTDKWIMKYLKQYPNITTYKELMEISNNG